MLNSIAKLQSPALVGVVRERTKRAAVAEIQNCRYDGATLIDLHLSCLENSDVDTLKEIVAASKLPILALNYNRTYTMESMNLSEEERVASFLRAAKAGVAGIDMQGYTFHLPSRDAFCGEDKYSFTKNMPKEVITDEGIIAKQCEFIEKIHSMGVEVLLSCHPDIPMKGEDVVELALFLEKRNPDVIKLVTKANNDDEAIEALRTMKMLKREVKTPVSYHANSCAGGLSRIINPLLGSHMVFCIDRYSESSTMEQLDLKTAKSVIEGLKKII